MASQAGERENSKTNGPEHTIVFSILTDLIFKRSNGIVGPTNEQAKQLNSINKLQNS
jgi:hypothetical protein